MDADVVVVGSGLAGLVATAEHADAGKRVGTHGYRALEGTFLGGCLSGRAAGRALAAAL